MIFSCKSLSTLLINIILVMNVCMWNSLFAQNNSRKEYIEKYKDLAIRQMEQYGIPASIILAQACLESGNGNSRLAVKANNHFGIKCNSWSGKRIYHNDDKAGECFRKYNSPEDSFKDHSEFLRNGKRYQSLFDLKRDDYKSWAHGLKAAGYATNPKYAELLIDIIEKYQLYTYDSGRQKSRKTAKRRWDLPEHIYTYSIDRQIYTCNGSAYIIATGQESYASIAKEYNLFKRELLKFNDLKKERPIATGTIIYIESKKNRGEKSTYVVQEDDTMYEISQKMGIKLSKLYRMNNMKQGTEPQAGKILNLQ